MAAEASAGERAAAEVEGDDGASGLRCCCAEAAASSRCAVVADEAESEGAPVHPGGAERMGLPATPRGMMRRDGEEEEDEEVEGAEEIGDDAEAEAEAEAAPAAAAAPLLFLAETAAAAEFIFGLRRTGACFYVFFVVGFEGFDAKCGREGGLREGRRKPEGVEGRGKKNERREEKSQRSENFRDSTFHGRIRVDGRSLRPRYVHQATRRGRWRCRERLEESGGI